MIQVMWRFLCTGIFILRGFLIQFFLLQKLVIISKTYRAKVSTADSSYVVEGKITLVAVVQKSWFDFEQNQEHLKELKLIDKSELNHCLFPKHLVAECSWRNSLDPKYNLFSLYLKLKRQSKSLLHKMEENCPKHF